MTNESGVPRRGGAYRFDPFEAAPLAPPEPEDLDGEIEYAAEELLNIIRNDEPRFNLCDDYMRGHHRDPYMPPSATEEYKMLRDRAVSNWAPLIVGTPAQGLYVDDFRGGNESGHEAATWTHWQDSGMDARQHAVYRGAFVFGHSFVVTEREADGVVRSRGLSALSTAAIFEDPANDLGPAYALTIVKEARTRKRSSERIPGTAFMWDEENKYLVRFDGQKIISIVDQGPHGNTSCPVTRFSCAVDLEGRTVGLVEPIIPLLDRINQTIFDLLIAQSYGSFKVRTVTGMAPPMLTQAVYEQDVNGEDVWYLNGQVVAAGTAGAVRKITGAAIVKDPNTGKPVPAPMESNASRWQFAANKDVKFGQLDETPLDGYIASLDMSIKHLSAITQTPPHYLLGQIANLSAEALQAAEISLQRKIQEFQSIFGEAWERVFRLAGELEGESQIADDTSAEVVWRDMESSSLSKTADGLLKLSQVGVPMKALWSMIDGVTRTQLDQWDKWKEDEDSEMKLANVLDRNRPTPYAPEVDTEEDVNATTSTGSTGGSPSN